MNLFDWSKKPKAPPKPETPPPVAAPPTIQPAKPTKLIPCPHCDGWGWFASGTAEKPTQAICQACDGRGKVEQGKK